MKCRRQVLADLTTSVMSTCRHVKVLRHWTKSWLPVKSRFLDTLPRLRVMFLRTRRSAVTSICRLVVLLVSTGDDALVDPALDGQIRFDRTRAVHRWNSGDVPFTVVMLLELE